MFRIHIYMKVKFRAFFITFGTVEKTFDVPLPIPYIGSIPLPTKPILDFNERGVQLKVNLDGQEAP